MDRTTQDDDWPTPQERVEKEAQGFIWTGKRWLKVNLSYKEKS